MSSKSLEHRFVNVARFLRADFFGDISSPLFWALICAISLIRLLLTSDINVALVNHPHDGTLYVSRAYYLLMGEGLGPYNSLTLVKLPGISFWIAFVRALGIPFIISLNIMYLLSGIYVVAALRRIGTNSIALMVAYLAYSLNLFNFHPLYSMREPLDISLFVFMLGSMVFLWHGIRRLMLPVGHLLIFSVAMSFALLLREEGVLLYGLLGLLAAGAVYYLWQHDLRVTRTTWVILAIVLIFPLLTVVLGNLSARAFIRSHYGVGLVYDFGDGEFPKFIAALRSVNSDLKSTYLSIPQENLDKVARVVPHLLPVFQRIQPAPGPGSWFHQAYEHFRGLKNEWPNSHIFFWIKDAAFYAGMTPNLREAEAYFKRARIDIEAACSEGKLSCERDGSGLFPAFKIGWIPIMFNEAIRGMEMMVDVGESLPQLATTTFPPGNPRGPAFNISLGNKIAVATMAHFDSLSELKISNVDSSAQSGPLPLEHVLNLYSSLGYWLAYPDIAVHGTGYGLRQHLTGDIVAQVRKALAPFSVAISSTTPVKSLTENQRNALSAAGLFGEQDLTAGWGSAPLDLYLSLQWLILHPETALKLKPNSYMGEGFGAYQHYIRHGRGEGRIFLADASRGPLPVYSSLRLPSSVLANLRPHLGYLSIVYKWLILLGLVALTYRLTRGRRNRFTEFELLVVAFLLFSGLKLAALSYVSASIGHLGSRMYFSTHSVLVLLMGTFLIQTFVEVVANIAATRRTLLG